MTMGPEPMSIIFLRSVLLGMDDWVGYMLEIASGAQAA
jgi:hypothetical protein